LFGFLLICSCSRAERTASYRIDEGLVLQVRLETIHPFLAEYERTAILVREGKPSLHRTMMLDPGGYSATNLYACGSGVFVLESFFDVWKIDSTTGAISESDCADRVYLGVFDGSPGGPWQFNHADLRPEVHLVPSGG
jgi:hypothetical protein